MKSKPIKCYVCEGSKIPECAEQGSDPKDNELVTCSDNQNACYTLTGSKHTEYITYLLVLST